MEEDQASQSPACLHVLRSVARLLNGEPRQDEVSGTFMGSKVQFSYTRSTSGERSTSIDVELPLDCSLVLSLRRAVSKTRPGEETFHRMLSGIAAPLDLVERLLDRSTCERLCGLGLEFELSSHDCVVRELLQPETIQRIDQLPERDQEPYRDRKLLRLGFLGWLDEPEIAARAIENMASIAQRLPEVQATADAALLLEQADAPYRGTPIDASAKLAARQQEIVRAKRAIAKSRKHKVSDVLAVVFLIPLLLLAVLLNAPAWLFRKVCGGR